LRGEKLRLLCEHGSRPVLERLRAYLLQIQAELLPKSEAGQAVAYTLKNWTALTRYRDDPDLAIDNNHTERALRCFAVGRANSTFFAQRSRRQNRSGAVQFRHFLRASENRSVRVVPRRALAPCRVSDHQARRIAAASLGCREERRSRGSAQAGAEDTSQEAIADWRYWVSQDYRF
jgi:Transposase IS66 family